MSSLRSRALRVHALPLVACVILLSACGSQPEPAENAAAVADETIGNVAAANLMEAGVAVNDSAPEEAAPAVKPEEPAPAAQASEPAAAAPAATPVASSGDAANGAKLFVQCRVCHSVEPDKNGLGPSLHGVMGRKAGTLAGFNFSPAMAGSGIVWMDETMSDYLRAPMKSMPGTKMAFAGIPQDDRRADVIAYLATLK